MGTLAHVTSWDMEQLGILQLGVRGGRRFRILETQTRPMACSVPASACSMSRHGSAGAGRAGGVCCPFCRKIAADLGPEKMPLPHPWDDAAWVGYRLTEVMPVQLLAKQKLLELDDAVSRLEILFKYLAQRGLVK